MAAISGGAGLLARRSCATGGFVRGGFVNCRSANTTTTAAKVHLKILLIRSVGSAKDKKSSA